ncbi:hypothetical protein VQD75_001182 [Vibrio alginolyticus]|uniref:hypothetical protein n=1 Tax=Vibrio parahaemolyticus TaxID=670 RepID=UPI00081C0FBF|nr:hypothetical protein [Vibrio parahaemolyticus]EMD1210225.1 hypothetical protein [Vibrio alginolyticus]
MRIEYLLIVIVSLLTLISVLGVGVAIGGGSEASATVHINAISAFAACVSSVSTLGTLILLILVRNDWLKPKEHETKTELKLALIEWQEVICSLNLYLVGFRSDSDIETSITYIEALQNKEEEAWLNIKNVLKRYTIFFPESSLEQSSLYPLNDLRFQVLFSSSNYLKYIRKQESYPIISKSFSEVTIGKDIQKECSVVMEMV